MLHAVKVKLNSGQVALVDRSDYTLVSEYSWINGGAQNRYAASLVKIGDSVQTIYLHRLVMGAGEFDIVDHINGDTLDCRKANLRFATASQNAANRTYTTNALGYRGVAYYPIKRRFQARLQKDGGVYRGPYQKKAIQAAEDYDALARGLFGEFATLNFPKPGERGVKVRSQGEGE